MTKKSAEPLYAIDCHGLKKIADTRSNSLKDHCLELLKNGVIAVPTCVWQEFEELYEDEAAELAPYVTLKIKMKQAYYLGAASIADKTNPGFSLSPYDGKTDFYAAAVCSVEGLKLLTIDLQMKAYQKMNACKFLDIESVG